VRIATEPPSIVAGDKEIRVWDRHITVTLDKGWGDPSEPLRGSDNAERTDRTAITESTRAAAPSTDSCDSEGVHVEAT
jgi:hypothetical protein